MRRIAFLFATATALVAAPVQAQGVEVKVAFDASRIETLKENGARADDPVRIASISKLVVALGVMRMVEAGTLDLDRDVSHWLGWRLRNPAFPDTPITLRLLLSHRSSLTDGGDYVIPLGENLERWVGRPGVWDSNHAPGGFFRYTNLNFPVVASVMEKASGERFDRLTARLVLDPLKLDACFNWTTCGDDKIRRAVVLRDASGAVLRDDLQGKRPDCPVVPAADGSCDLAAYVPGTNGALFSPQGGLRISARDLAKIGRMLLKDGDGFLKPASVAALAGPLWVFDGTNGVTGEGDDDGFYCAYGLAVQTLASRRADCRDDPSGDRRPSIGHAGDAYGLRSGLWIDRATRRGVAFFVTAVPDGARGQRSAFTAAEEAMLAPPARAP